MNSNRQVTSIVTSFLTTITPSASAAQTQQQNATSSSTTSSVGPLPTAPTNVDPGGDAPGGAPHPGQSGPGGIYGPPDTYISPAIALPVNTLLAVTAGIIAGGALLVT